MINVFKIKKYGALILVGFISVLFFTIGIMFYDFWVAMMLFPIGLATSMLAANYMLVNPFTEMLEGKGILVLNLDSTGVIRPFIVAVQSPFITGKIGKKKLLIL